MRAAGINSWIVVFIQQLLKFILILKGKLLFHVLAILKQFGFLQRLVLIFIARKGAFSRYLLLKFVNSLDLLGSGLHKKFLFDLPLQSKLSLSGRIRAFMILKLRETVTLRSQLLIEQRLNENQVIKGYRNLILMNFSFFSGFFAPEPIFFDVLSRC
jgi:hypothetical protein